MQSRNLTTHNHKPGAGNFDRVDKIEAFLQLFSERNMILYFPVKVFWLTPCADLKII